MSTPTRTLIPDALGPAECQRLIARARAQGFRSASPAYPPSYRNNDRLVLDDDELAASLFARLRAHLPQHLTIDGAGWTLVGLNPRFRFCRYHAGQRFSIHRDGVQHRGDREQTLLTFMVYLNGADAFEGGATRFFASRDPDGPVTAEIPPRAGALIVFDHTLWHDGAPVTGGEKLIMRSDIFYRRDEPLAPHRRRQHQGYVWTALPASDGTLLTGSRDKTLRRWAVDGTSLELLDEGRGHPSSVLAVAEPGPGVVWTSDRDGWIRRWSLGGLQPIGSPLYAHAGAVLCLTSAGDGRLVSGGADGVARLWSADGQPVAELADHGGWVWAAALTADGQVVTGCEDGTLTVWTPGAPRPDARTNLGAPVRAVLALGDEVIAGLADGRVLRLSPADPGAARLWAGHVGAVRALAALPEERVASGGEDDTVRVWSRADDRCLGVDRHADFVTCLAVTSEGQLVSGSYDGTVRVRAA